MTKIFGVGTRVLCIDGKFDPFVVEFVDEVPVEGGIYTVRSIRLGGFDNVTRQPIALEEFRDFVAGRGSSGKLAQNKAAPPFT